MLETVIVALAFPLATGVTDAGEKLQATVAVAGEMPQLKVTTELKLFSEVTLIVDVVESPAITIPETGEAPKLKSLTIRV